MRASTERQRLPLPLTNPKLARTWLFATPSRSLNSRTIYCPKLRPSNRSPPRGDLRPGGPSWWWGAASGAGWAAWRWRQGGGSGRFPAAVRGKGAFAGDAYSGRRGSTRRKMLGRRQHRWTQLSPAPKLPPNRRRRDSGVEAGTTVGAKVIKTRQSFK